MVQDAEAHAEEDKKRRELIEVRNAADSLIYTTEKNIGEYGDKIPEEDKTAIETDLAALKEAMEADDVEAIKEKTGTLTQSSMKLGEAMYKASQEGGDAGPMPDDQAAAPDDGVVDADFEEVDDDKKDKSA